MILGLDPGISTTGVGLVDEGRLIQHKTLPGKEAMIYIVNLHSIYRYTRSVVEMPRTAVIYGRHMTKKNAVFSQAGMIKLAQNVGMNIQLARDFIEKLKEIGSQVLDVNPKRGSTKWDAEYWRKVFQWEGRVPSQHARDASILALQWEKWVGWSVESSEKL